MTRIIWTILALLACDIASAKDYVVLFSASYCQPCRQVKKIVVPELKAAGIPCVIIDVQSDAIIENVGVSGRKMAAGYDVSSIPAICLMTEGSNKIQKRWNGYTPSREIIDASKALHRSESAQHRKVFVTEKIVEYQRPSSVMWGGMAYTGRVCNKPGCQMCSEIQAGLDQLIPVMVERTVATTQVDPGKAGAPSELVEQMLELLELQPDDVFADIGCGDGRILIAAASRCRRVVGIEIDTDKADECRRNVAQHGLQDRVTVITGDACDFDPEAWGVTVATAYLYPETLQKLSRTIRKIRRVASPFHEVPGVDMILIGDVWVKR